MALPPTPIGYDNWNDYIETNAPALAIAQGLTLQEAKASIKLLDVSEPIRSDLGQPYYREYNVFTTWAERQVIPQPNSDPDIDVAPGRPWRLTVTGDVMTTESGSIITTEGGDILIA